MEQALQFFSGLDSQASLTFMGILVGAFLLGLLPVGINYGYRLKAAKRKTGKFREAYQRTSQERNMLMGKMQRAEQNSQTLTAALKEAKRERTRAEADLAQIQAELDEVRAESLRTQIARHDHEDYVTSLRNKIASLQGNVATLKANSRPQAQPPGFDVNMISSLKASKTRVKALEDKVTQLMADNEKLRRELAA